MAKKSFKLRNKNMSVNSTGIFAIVLSKDSKKDIEELCDQLEFETEAFLGMFQEQRISD